MIIQPHSKFVLAGDSVTDMGRTQPIGQGLFNPHGTGYPNVIQGLLTSVYPDFFINVVNMGYSGNTSRDLLNRLERDILSLKPDYLSVMIGANDVWRQFDTPQIPENSVLPEEYRENLINIVRLSKTVTSNIILMAPVYWESSLTDAMSARMREYGQIVREVSAQEKVLFCDVQSRVDRVLKHCNANYITWDRVHPNIPGANVIAHALLDTLEFDWKREC